MYALSRRAYGVKHDQALCDFLKSQEIRREYPDPIEAPSILIGLPFETETGIEGVRLVGSFLGKSDENAPVFILEVSEPQALMGKWWLSMNIKNKRMCLMPAA